MDGGIGKIPRQKLTQDIQLLCSNASLVEENSLEGNHKILPTGILNQIV